MSGRILSPSTATVKPRIKTGVARRNPQPSTRTFLSSTTLTHGVKRSRSSIVSTDDDGPKIVVGLDFGTTYSGAAFSFVSDNSQVHAIKRWPGNQSLSFDKVPTLLAYDHNNIRWGLEVRDDDSVIRCIKLLLEPDANFPTWAKRDFIEQQLVEVDKEPIDVVTDFLRRILHVIDENIRQTYGRMKATRYYVVTVPGAWSDLAQSLTNEAAKAAGISKNLSLVSEPEAAAIHTLSQLDGLGLGPHEAFMVCDAGGGTVDLITYQLVSSCPPRMREIIPSTGGLCGSVFLNYAFEDWIERRVGTANFQVLRDEHCEALAGAMRHFEEQVKRNFDAVSDLEIQRSKGFRIPFLGIDSTAIPSLGIRAGYVVLPYNDVANMFSPLVEQILGLIQAQLCASEAIKTPVHAIILVGGFGQSCHLLNKISEAFSTVASVQSEDDFTSPRGIKALRVVQAPDAWTAVAKGAVMHGLGNHVTSRKAKRSYGIVYDRECDKPEASDTTTYWHEATQTWRAMDQMGWFIVKGQCVVSNRATLLPFEMTFEETAIPQSIEIRLFSSEADDPPLAYVAAIRSHCRLLVQTDDISARTWKTITDAGGNRHKKLHFQLGMLTGSAGLTFDLRTSGKTRGSVKATFE